MKSDIPGFDQAQKSLSHSKLPRRLLIALAVILLGLIVGTSAALYQRNQTIKADKAAATSAAVIRSQDDLKAQLKIAQEYGKSEHDKRAAVCAYVATASRTKPTAGFIVVPVKQCD